ncbi:MAG: hypothetical protein U9P90_02350 [Patescibacteria group bacterium]|nr:hypothetical protein [Patescibacteria group bacterium]
MSVSESDIKFRKSTTVTDTSSNGGRKSQTLVVSGARHSLFPRVTKSERTDGVTRYRKEFFCNDNADDDIGYGVLLYLELPSNSGDRFYLGEGDQSDIQSSLATYDPTWMGAGQLETLLSGGESSISLTMENSDFRFENDGYIHITDKYKTSQTVDSDVNIGDSVTYSSGTWSKITAQTDIDYPDGIYIGSSTVMTIETGTNEEWLQIAKNYYPEEDIGNGDGADTSPALTTLSNNTNGICLQPGLLPMVTATIGAVTKTVNVASDGSCSGYCSAGTLNMTTGVWTTDITWTVAPDNGTDIKCTYCENAFAYSGNVATIALGEQVANAYATANSYGGGCIYSGEIKPRTDNWTETTSSGTYDESTYPLTLFNDGTEEDTFTFTFTNATAFTCSGTNAGSVGTGSVSADFSPTNADTGQPYFTLLSAGWGGTWASGETVQAQTHPATLPVWLKEVVPAGTAQESYNLCVVGYYVE